MRKSFTGITVILFSILLALASVLYKSHKADRCDYDGTKITPVYEVDIILDNGDTLRFCSVFCAKAWLRDNPSEADAVNVTDEITGEKIDASLAHYVESDVVTVSATWNRIHAFKDKKQAFSHARQHNGRFVENPFQ